MDRSIINDEIELVSQVEEDSKGEFLTQEEKELFTILFYRNGITNVNFRNRNIIWESQNANLRFKARIPILNDRIVNFRTNVEEFGIITLEDLRIIVNNRELAINSIVPNTSNIHFRMTVKASFYSADSRTHSGNGGFGQIKLPLLGALDIYNASLIENRFFRLFYKPAEILILLHELYHCYESILEGFNQFENELERENLATNFAINVVNILKSDYDFNLLDIREFEKACALMKLAMQSYEFALLDKNLLSEDVRLSENLMHIIRIINSFIKNSFKLVL